MTGTGLDELTHIRQVDLVATHLTLARHLAEAFEDATVVISNFAFPQ